MSPRGPAAGPARARAAAAGGVRAAAAGFVLVLAAACTAPEPPRSQAGGTPVAGAGMSTCRPPQRGVTPPAETPTTIDVVEEAYYCVLAHHYSGATLDARALLTAGFAGLTLELDRNDRDVAAASMPPLTGERWTDWKSFEAAFRTLSAGLPEELTTKLAVATLEAMLGHLGTNHTTWTHDAPPRNPDAYSGDLYGLGLRANLSGPQAQDDRGGAQPPLYVATVLGGAAREAGLRPGDVIESVDGRPPFAGGRVDAGAVAALYPAYPDTRPVRLGLRRESTGRRWTVELRPGLFQPDLALLQGVTAKLLGERVAYLRVAAFAPQVADRVFRVLARMRAGRSLGGVVLDLRGNTGGSPVEVNRLLGAFAHGKVTGHQCTPDGECREVRTDDTVALLGLPLVVLTDRGCASACDHFASAVRAHGLGKLVGTRTAGVVFGLPATYFLSNGTTLGLPATHFLGPRREEIDRIGVPPDVHLPLTAADVAAGRDPAVDRALSLLGSTFTGGPS
ncbi:S41 family peptidase [Nonomuraea sp. NPDC050328]|uniref:S41 family peptidase n=1 Tax=Nonomuraea sp. NPDC050328 TaxID=3364361 RepID=UPI0037981C24